MIINKYASCGLRGSHLSEYGEYIRRGTFAQRAREAGSISVSSVFCLLMTLFITSPACEITKIQLYILKISLTPGYSRDVLRLKNETLKKHSQG